MVEKFYAHYFKDGNPPIQINSIEALKLKESEKIDTQDKSKRCLFDYPDIILGNPMYPRKNKKSIPSFVYYSNSKNFETIDDVNREMTPAHLLFQNIFTGINEFKIKINNQDIVVNYQGHEAQLEYRIITDNSKGYIIDIFIDLTYTKPFSYFYMWNGRICIEIYVTHKTTHTKAKELAEEGYFVYEVAIPKKYQKVVMNREVMSNPEVFQEMVTYFRELYSKDGFYLFGRSLNKPNFKNDDWQKAFMNLDYLERQKNVLNNDLDDLKDKYEKKSKDIADSEKYLEEIKNLQMSEQQRLESIKNKKNEALSQIEEIKQENGSLETLHEKLELEKHKYQKIKSLSLFERIFRWKRHVE